MGFWSVILPQDTQNKVANPSAEKALTGYNGLNANIAQSAARQKRGVRSVEVTPTASTGAGVYYEGVALVGGNNYTFSVDVWGVLGVPYRAYFADDAGNLLGTATEFTGIGDWQRISVARPEIADATRRLYVTKNNSASTGAFYVDGLQVENGLEPSTYCDGDQVDCKWDGEEHASTSTRDGQSRAGGLEVNLDDYGLFIKEAQGIGMPPTELIYQRRALLPGAIWRDVGIGERTFEFISELVGNSRVNLHYIRKRVIDALKPDAVKGLQPVLFKYYGANENKALQIEAAYDGGLGWAALDGFTEQGKIGLVAFDPFYYEDGDSAQVLSVSQTLDNVNNAIAKIGGVWTNLGGGCNGEVKCIAYGPDGSIYLGGSFTQVGGSTTAYRIARYKDGQWYAMGNGFNASVEHILVGPDGTVYACGTFTGPGSGVGTFYRIAKWNGTSWSQLGSGLNNDAYQMAWGTDGKLYVVGEFSTAGGISCSRFARWTGWGWQNVGSGLNGYGYSIIAAQDGSLYLGGAFTTAGGVTVNRICRYRPSTGVYSALSTGLNGNCYGLCVAADGVLYACGAFTTAGGVTVNYIASWNGVSWAALSTGMDNTVYGVEYFGGLIYAIGQFTQAGGLALNDKVAVWNGHSWMHLDIDLPGAAAGQAITVVGSDIYLGFSGTGSAATSAVTQINNGGSRTVYPKIVFKRSGGDSGNIVWVKNQTTGATLRFNYELSDGETLTLDLTQGKRKATSSFFGRVWRAVLRTTEVTAFNLLPGANNIDVLVNGSGVEVYMIWKNVHWSADGVAVAS